MRVCYHIQSHKLPAQVHRLVSRLTESDPGCIVLVSHDTAGTALDVTKLCALGDVHVLPATGGYGDYSHLERYFDSAEWLRRRDVDYDWFTNLTGQDYPAIAPLDTRRFLEASDQDGYLGNFPVLSSGSPWGTRRGRDRYYFGYRRLRQLTTRQRGILRGLQVINRAQPVLRVNVSYGLSVGVRARTPFDDDLICYGGSFFATLRRTCVEYVADFAASHPQVVRHYRGVLAPEESFLQTVLVNSDRFRLSGDCKRYFDFSQTTYNHPRTLTINDLDAIVASGAHFARKFDMTVDSAVLDQLDAHMSLPQR
jgi:hypothetical protein